MQADRLNLFGRLFRQWRTLHPYNAAQAMRLAAPPPDKAWPAAAAPLLVDAGTAVRVEGTIDAQFTAELNRPFAPAAPPLRAWVTNGGDGQTWAGVTYDHWVADSVGVRLLMRRWAQAAAGRRMSPLIPDAPGRWRAGEPVGDLVRGLHTSGRLRRCRRVGGGDLSAAYLTHELPPGLCGRLLAAARRRGVRLNDVFTAAAARAVAAHLPAERWDRRADLAVGSIVDTRRHLPAARRELFGLHLGFGQTAFRPTDLADLDRAVLVARRQARLAEHRRLPARGGPLLAGALAAGRVLDRRRLGDFYRKRQPLLAGISNVNLDPTFLAPLHPDPIGGYLRLSPLGPATPIVFAPTTLGGELTLGVTHRPAVLGGRQADCVAAFVDDLVRFASSGGAAAVR